MIFTKNGIEIKFDKSESNRLWRPIGIFRNNTYIKYQNKWHRCNIGFRIENGIYYILISNLWTTSETNHIVRLEGIEIKFKVSWFNWHLLQYYEGTGMINRKVFKFFDFINKKRIQISVASFLILLGNLLYILNRNSDNLIIKFTQENELIQIILIVLSILGAIGLFIPLNPLFTTKTKEKAEKEKMQKLLKEHERKKALNDKIDRMRTF